MSETNNLLIIDPNKCGRNSVNTEDLNIFVELKVYSRQDDVIITTTDGTTSALEGKGETVISFFNSNDSGVKDDNKKSYLTTSYTELNYKLNNKNTASEVLGIESIDINFNTSYAPIVNIRFKDVRGTLFDMGNDSPYAFLFQMPYPIFYLTVKGYYGKPVEYALHLTKFNGALDSKTGSFIINCDFIGYTYAYLSDILMGLVKAIPYTEIGKSKIADKPDFTTFPALMTTVKKLNDEMLKYRNTDKQLKALTIYGDLDGQLSGIESILKSILSSSDKIKESKAFQHIYSVKNLQSEDLKNFIETYRKDFLSEVIRYNETNNTKNTTFFKLKWEYFEIKNDDTTSPIFYNPSKKDDFLDGDTYLDWEAFQKSENIDNYLNFKEINDGDEDKNIKISRLYNEYVDFIKTDEFSATDKIIDLRAGFDLINELKSRIENDKNKKKKVVAADFSSTISEFLLEQGINYDGSIGAIFKILCSHVDLFIDSIREVAKRVIEDKSNNRNISTSSNADFPEYTSDGGTTIKLKPFPEFVGEQTIDNDKSLVDKWLGSDPKFYKFEEVKFINDLYEALLKKEEGEAEFQTILDSESTGWYPINPLDTIAYNPQFTNPWLTVYNNNKNSIYKLLIQRMGIFLFYGNKNLTTDEIKNMAKIEANQAYSAIVNGLVRDSIIKNSDSDVSERVNKILDLVFETYGINIKEVEEGGTFNEAISGFRSNQPTKKAISSYYVTGSSSLTPIPLREPITEVNPISDFKPVVTKLIGEDYRKKLDNVQYPYFSTLVNSGVDNNEVFIKIIDSNAYDNNYTFINILEDTGTNILNDFNNSDIKINKYSDIFGGKFKTHEFLTYKGSDGELPVYLKFYKGGSEDVKNYRGGSKVSKYDTFIKDGNNLVYNTNVVPCSGVKEIKDLNKNYDKTTLAYILNSNILKTPKSFKFQPTFTTPTLNDYKYSLFGSEFYYEQQTQESKAFLFLHSIPFYGLHGKIEGLFEGIDKKFFNERAGFVEVPYSWVLFMGGILFRYAVEGNVNIRLIDDSGKRIIPSIRLSKDTTFKRNDYLSIEKGLSFGDNNDTPIALNNIIKNLPSSVKRQFIDEFKTWVDNPNGWGVIRDKLEIFDTENITNPATRALRNSAWDNIETGIQRGIIKSSAKDNYFIISQDVRHTNPSKADIPSNFFLDLRDGGPAVTELNKFLTKTKIIINTTYKIWEDNSKLTTNFSPLLTESDNVTNYLTSFLNEFRTLNIPSVSKTDELNEQLFNSRNVNDIKLNLYKNIKSIYDKWIVGVSPDNKGVVINNLYDRFSFIDRSYSDISSKLKVSPTGFVNYLIESENISFYNFISRILVDNNLDFHPLPTFRDFNNTTELKEVFEPTQFNEKNTSTGPKFICMYIGEKSNRLDNENNSKKNDGIYIESKCSVDGNDVEPLASSIPTDFDSTNFKKVPYFLVGYGDQNQSIFKEYKLDQTEFTETMESLQIIDDMTSQNRNSSLGQNLFDVYNNRSYSAEIEMLGCAEIQPFMYFQLNNIPMFRGAFTIINTRHSITPNSMTTTFKGVRIRKVKTKMIDDETLFYNLITNLSDINSDDADYKDFYTKNSVNKSNITTKVTAAQLKQNQIDVKNYFRDKGYSAEITAGVMGNIQVESSFKLSAVNAKDTNALESIGLIQWNFGSYKSVFELYNSNKFSTVTEQLDYLTNKMTTWNTFISSVKSIDNEQYVAFLFAHYVEVCCGCASTKGYTKLYDIYRGPYTHGWRCPQADPNAGKFYPHKRSEAASQFMIRFNDPTDSLYWDKVV